MILLTPSFSWHLEKRKYEKNAMLDRIIREEEIWAKCYAG